MQQLPNRDEHKALAEFYDKLELVIYLLTILIATPTVARMLSDAWYSYGIAPSVFFAVRDSLSVSHPELVLFVLGAYAGLLTLLLLDHLKRVQGTLLTLASVIALAELRTQGLFTPLYPVANVHAIVAGFVFAYLVGGGYKIHRSEPPYEFRRATGVIFWTVATIVSVGFLEKHLTYRNPLGFAVEKQAEATNAGLALAGEQMMTDFVLSSMFIGGALMFISYEAKTNVFVMGPQRAGKTLLAGGLNIIADNETESIRLNPSGPLSKLVTSLRTATSGWGDDEYVGPTKKGEYKLLQFQTQAGYLFREYVEIDVLDYAGEYLDGDLVDKVESYAPKRRFSLTWLAHAYESIRGLPSLPEEAKGLSSDKIQRILAKQIIHSDTMVVTIDAGSLLSEVPYGDDDYEVQQDLSEYLDTYVQILRHVNQSLLAEKEVVIVVTKADYLYQLYRNTNTQLRFFEWVNFYLLESKEGRERLGPLVNQAQVDRVYPVYYDLDHEASMEQGEPVPDRPIDVQGSEQLLNRLKESA